jgi:hypothetical protein
MSYKNIDELAAAMENILNDDTYRSVFERPRIKMASAEEPVKSDKTDVDMAYEQLVEASNLLDKLGLVKSAAFTLLAVEKLLEESNVEAVVGDKIDKIQGLSNIVEKECESLEEFCEQCLDRPGQKYELHPKRMTQPFEDRGLSGRLCDSCAQEMSTEQKRYGPDFEGYPKKW